MKVKHVMREVELGISHCDDEGKGGWGAISTPPASSGSWLLCALLSYRAAAPSNLLGTFRLRRAGECERASAQGATHTRKRQREMGKGKGKAGRRTLG